MTFASGATASAECKDTKILSRVQKRLLTAFERLGTWRKAAAGLGINHGHVSLSDEDIGDSDRDVAEARVKLARLIPSNIEVRLALGFPSVLPSERKVRMKRIIPVMGSEGWERIFFRRLHPRKWRITK